MINKAILVGHVGQDPEVRSMQNNKSMASFSVATMEKWKDKDSGERKEKTEWHRVVCFNEKLVDVIKRYVKKGSKVYVEGQITSRKWDDNGIERTAYEINLKHNGILTLLDKKRDDSPPDSAYEEGQ